MTVDVLQDRPGKDSHSEALSNFARVWSAMWRIEVVREADLRAGEPTQGITRDKAFDLNGIAVSRSRISGGVASAWHHHGARHLHGFLVSGRLRLEYGPDGTLAVDVSPGDFFHIPPRLVHRDVNPSRGDTSVVVNVLTGEGASVVNVDGPNPS